MIKTELMKHQKAVVEFCCRPETKEYAGIFSEYGTGKTLMALALVEQRHFRKVLIVAPKLAIESTWCDEIKKHTNFRYCILQGTAKQKLKLLEYALGRLWNPERYGLEGVPARPMLFLINYEGVKSIWRELYRVKFDAIFADESTKIKTFDAERTKALFEVGETAKFRCVMTGFPVTENLGELYSQIKFIDRGKTFGLSYWKFLNKYFVRIGYKTVLRKKSVNKILDAIKPFCIRVTNDMLKLPPKVYS
jgi:SNF2 family DNA or RNA helicase